MTWTVMDRTRTVRTRTVRSRTVMTRTVRTRTVRTRTDRTRTVRTRNVRTSLMPGPSYPVCLDLVCPYAPGSINRLFADMFKDFWEVF